MLELILFTNDIEFAKRAEDAGVGRILVDLEKRGKTERQHGYHLECNNHTIEDVYQLKKYISIPIIVRINPISNDTEFEIENAISAGANVLMLPMFRTLDELNIFLKITKRRAKTMALIETKESVAIANKINDTDIDEIYIGLNDLALSYGKTFCFEFLSDGLLDSLRKIFYNKPFGFGGIATLDNGYPLSTKYILCELARLDCNYVIVRRAFKHGIERKNIKQEVKNILNAYEKATKRFPKEIEKDRQIVKTEIEKIIGREPVAKIS